MAGSEELCEEMIVWAQHILKLLQSTILTLY